MRISIYPQSCIGVHANILNERPLGGTETGIVRLAEALHTRGHEVTVYTSHPNPPDSQPRYLPLNQAQFMQQQDAVIVVREWFPLLGNIPAKKKFLWTGDAPDQIHTVGIGDKRVVNAVDGIFAVSEWQANALANASGFPRKKIQVIRNGIHLPYFEGSEKRENKRLIYSSTPFRGLKFLPIIFKNLKQLHPDVSLHVFSGMKLYASNRDNAYHTQLEQQYAPVFEELEKMEGVFVHGNVSQQQLSREFMKSSILCYPNTFVETSCITAMEAQAAGCAVVTSKLGALPETVGKAGLMVDEAPGSREYLEHFIACCNELLSNQSLWEQFSEEGLRKKTSELSWEKVAERVERFISDKPSLAKHFSKNLSGIIQE